MDRDSNGDHWFNMMCVVAATLFLIVLWGYTAKLIMWIFS